MTPKGHFDINWPLKKLSQTFFEIVFIFKLNLPASRRSSHSVNLVLRSGFCNIIRLSSNVCSLVRIPVDLSFSNFSLWSSASKFLILCRDIHNFLLFIFLDLERGPATLTAQVGDAEVAEVGKCFTDGMTEMYK